jgi:hypothetical protein
MDRQRAEALLHDLATKLVRVPLGPRTRGVHLRALALKRELGTWASAPPPEDRRRAIVEELIDLQRQAAECTRHPSGQVLVRAGRPFRWNAA